MAYEYIHQCPIRRKESQINYNKLVRTIGQIDCLEFVALCRRLIRFILNIKEKNLFVGVEITKIVLSRNYENKKINLNKNPCIFLSIKNSILEIICLLHQPNLIRID